MSNIAAGHELEVAQLGATTGQSSYTVGRAGSTLSPSPTPATANGDDSGGAGDVEEGDVCNTDNEDEAVCIEETEEQSYKRQTYANNSNSGRVMSRTSSESSQSSQK